MTYSGFGNLRSGLSDCPSDLALDRLHAGENLGDGEMDLRGHVLGCEACKGRMAVRRIGFAAFPELDPKALLARVENQRPAAPMPSLVERIRALFTRSFATLSIATVAAVALLLVLKKPEDAAPSGDGLRLKGGLTLHVHRLRDGRSEEALSGDSFRAGDQLRFAVDVPQDGHLSIVGVEPSGHLYSAWPLAQGAATQRKAGAGQLLEGAVTLDDTVGKETLYLVHCPLNVGPPRCTATTTSGAPSCGPTCTLSAFTLDKAP